MPESRPPLPLTYRLMEPKVAGALHWSPGTGPFGEELAADPNASLVSVFWQPIAFGTDECEAVVALGRSLPNDSARSAAVRHG